MKEKDRITKFIELQNKGTKFEDIALELGIAKSTLRVFLNKNGYKMYKGKYELKDIVDNDKQISFENESNTKNDTLSKNIATKNKRSKSIKVKVENINSKLDKSKVNKKESAIKKESKTIKRSTPKKDRKINLTQEDMDKLCEVYDWYMEVRDLKTMKNKTKTKKKDITIEDTNLISLKSTSIKVDKKTWEDFERLCSNSEFSKQEILTQALKDFMKEYKNLL